MKTIFKPLLFAILVIAGLKGIAQCTAPNFTYIINPGGQVTFTDYSYNQDSLTGIIYDWNFGDGDSAQNSAYIVSHTYHAGGAYTVSLRIIQLSTGCDSTESLTINLNLCLGGAQYTESNTGFGAYTFTATNLSSLPGSTVFWSFGDGGTSTSTSPSHLFTATGNYNVSLIVTDASLSCADTLAQNLGVTLCTYPVGIDTTILSYGPADIQFQPSVPNAGYTYNWAFAGPTGTGNYANATGSSVTHTFLSSGYDSITLQITDATTGCALNVTNYDYINTCGVTAYFYSGGNGLTQSFSVYSYNDSLGSGGSIVASYAWSFPGATPSTGSGSEVSNIVYPAVGTYSACVYLTTNNGCLDTICNPVVVTAPVYAITGVATATGGSSGFTGTVYLIVQDSVGKLALLDSTNNVTDTAGLGFNYAFYNLPVDTYYVKAALSAADPDYADYLPTYYNDVLTWGTATPVIITNANATADISLIEGTNPGGPGFVAGYVSQGAGLVLGGSGNNNAKSAGAPLQGVQINLLTGTGGAVAYTYTDANGYYQFPGVALGSYQIYAEQLNKIPEPIDFTLTGQNPTDTSADITINSRTATGITGINNIEINEVYPNPVTGTVQLLIGCSQDVNATLKLVDVLGRTILSQQLELVAGQNTAKVNMETIAAGVYQLLIKAGTQQLTYKLVKAN